MSQIWEDMEATDLAIKAEDHQQRVPRSQRGGEVIEPMVSSQWFVKTKGMGEKALNAVKDGDIKIIPSRFEKVWYNWLEDIHDWCISRQLWWGHRIPVYYINGAEDNFVVARNMEEAKVREKPRGRAARKYLTQFSRSLHSRRRPLPQRRASPTPP